MHEVFRFKFTFKGHSHNGKIDAITFTSSKDITVHGYGIYKLYDESDDSSSDSDDESESLSGPCQFIEGNGKQGKVLYSEDNVQIKDGQDQTNKRVLSSLMVEVLTSHELSRALNHPSDRPT